MLHAAKFSWNTQAQSLIAIHQCMHLNTVPCYRSDTQILSIEPIKGALQYEGKEGVDVFPSEVVFMSGSAFMYSGFMSVPNAVPTRV